MNKTVLFGSASVALAVKDAALAFLVAPLIEELPEGDTASTHFSCIFETTAALHRPNDAVLVHDGSLGTGFAPIGQIHAAAYKEWLIVDGVGSVEVDDLKRSTQIFVLPGAERLAAATLTLYAIDAALCRTGQHLVHGAGLLLPSQDRAVLIFAPSGAGKTTASLALALHGFRMLTDDALVLEQSVARVWGLPRAMKVHWRTAELLPLLRVLLGPTWNHEGEQVLTHKAFAAVGGVAHGSSDVAAVFVLGDRSPAGHRVASISKTEVLVALASDNVGTSRRGVIKRQVRKMEALASLVAGVPSARLSVGTELSSLAACISAFCENHDFHSAKAASA
jgi:hypothetical protein